MSYVMALLKNAAKPFGKSTFHNWAVQTFGNGVREPFEESLFKTLWLRVRDYGKETEFFDAEADYLPDLLFQPAGPNMPAWSETPEIALFLLRTAEARCSSEAKEKILGVFFDAFPFVGKEIFPQACELAGKMAHDCGGKWLEIFGAGLFDAQGARRAAALLTAGESVIGGAARLLGVDEAHAAASAFTDLLWRESLQAGHTSARIQAALGGTQETLDAVLDSVRQDAEGGDHKLRGIGAEALFANAVLKPFEVPGAKTDRSVQRAVTGLLEHFLGYWPGGEGWKNIDEGVKELLRYWSVCASFDECFDAVSFLLRNSDVAQRQWMERKIFWERYLRARRIESCRLYCMELKRDIYIENYAGRFPSAIGKMGRITGRSGSKVMLLMEVSPDISVIEFSDNGSVRIFEGQLRPRCQRSYFWWDEIQGKESASVAHRGFWQGNVDYQLTDLTGLRRP
ncbi:MAG: hypothetical protein ACFWTZ_08290 [Burkholderia sp.]|jgi:hypothetical protein